MVRRLPNRFIGECSGYFKCLCMVHGFANAFVHQNVKDFVHKNKKYAFTDSFGYHLTPLASW